MKTCNACGESKPVEDFHRHRTNLDGRHGKCRACRNVEESTRHRSRSGRYKRARNLKNFYRLTEEGYQSMLAKHGGRCAACREAMVGTPHVDHDHGCCPGAKSCGSCVRGLLCRQCNLAIGLASDDPERLRLMAEYLEAHHVVQ